MNRDIHDLIKIKRMGVINITPNSFSDGDDQLSLSKLTQKIQDFGPVECVDIGAESTAPKSLPIDAETEWLRFQEWGLPLIEKISPQTLISIDTYHPETIFKLARQLKDRPFIWNDVSGQLDTEVESFLLARPNVYYVLSHNLAPTRSKASSHMDFVSTAAPEEFFWDMVSFFGPKIKRLREINVYSRVILDPCFGFSKTVEQNLYLMKNFAHLVREVNHPSWLVGISRKSFLRQKYGIDVMTPESREFLDQKHEVDLRELLVDFPFPFVWVRTHRPELLPTSFQLA
ncbi:MAG: dihydropteroate synthase [Bacteriovoracaceae bacterium]